MATYVLIHGAYQGGWIWKPTASRLREAGHLVYAPSLDGCADRRHSLRPGITVETRLNGELRQHGNTRDFIFPIDLLLRHITAAMTLYPGDLIPTGTPAGVAPMRPGDNVEVSIEGVGVLRNPVL